MANYRIAVMANYRRAVMANYKLAQSYVDRKGIDYGEANSRANLAKYWLPALLFITQALLPPLTVPCWPSFRLLTVTSSLSLLQVRMKETRKVYAMKLLSKFEMVRTSCVKGRNCVSCTCETPCVHLFVTII